MSTKNPPKIRILCIYGVFRPLYIFARIFGFFPFSLKPEANGIRSINFTIKDLFLFVVHVTIYSFFTYLNVAFNLMENSAASPLLALGMRIGLIFGLVNSVAFLFADLVNRHRIFDIFKSYVDFDAQMQLFGSTLNSKRIKRCVHLYIFMWLTMSVLYGSVSYWILYDLTDINKLTASFTSFYCSTSAFGIALSIYAFLIFSVRARFNLLNDTLRNLPIKAGESSNTQLPTKQLIENVMKLAELHDKLNNILDKVNRCYSIQAMLAFAVSFTFKVFALFSVYRGWIMSTVSTKQLNLSIVFSLWTTFYMFFVFTVLWAGHSSKKEGKFTGVLVHRAINKCHNTEIVERLMAFSYQINNKTPDANCNLFSFDWTLLYSIVAATTTYLIILIQFDASGYDPISFGSKNFSLDD